MKVLFLHDNSKLFPVMRIKHNVPKRSSLHDLGTHVVFCHEEEEEEEASSFSVIMN